MEHEVWVEIDLSAVKHNLGKIKEAVAPETGVIAVVKANAYGHGLEKIAATLDQAGAEMFAVTSIQEAIALRKTGITKSILNLCYLSPQDVEEAIERKIIATVYNWDSAQILHEQAATLHKPLKIHIKIDTGMSRLGISAAEAVKTVPKIIDLPYFRVEGIYSHFADESDAGMVKQQFEEMQNVLFQLQQAKRIVPAVHMAKSDILFQSTQYHYDAVRPGIALYGYSPTGRELKPALNLKTVLVQIKRIPKGAKVGYMQTYTAPSEMLIGILPIGYSHGYDRGLSNKGYVLVDDWKCPVIGRVCMSQTIIDLSPVRSTSRLHIGKEVTVIGKGNRQEIAVNEIAKLLDTNSYEIVTRIPSSVHRIYSGE